MRSEYNFDGTFNRNAFYVEGASGLKYRCGQSGALPQGYAESALYPQATLDNLPALIERQEQQIARLEGELPTLREIAARRWSKAEELARLKQTCKELQQKIEAELKKAERNETQPTDTEVEPTAAETEPTDKAA